MNELIIIGPSNKKILLDYHPNFTVADVKSFCFRKFGIPEETYILIKNGMALSDNLSLKKLGVNPGDTVEISIINKNPSYPFNPEELLISYMGRTLTQADKDKLKDPQILNALNLLYDGIEKAKEVDLNVHLPKFINKGTTEAPKNVRRQPNPVPPPPPPPPPPKPKPADKQPDLGQQYKDEIKTLRDMGFELDNDELIALLLEKGQVERVVEFLISNM